MRAIEAPEQSDQPRPGDESDMTGSIEPIRSRGYKRRLRDLLQKTGKRRSASEWLKAIYALHMSLGFASDRLLAERNSLFREISEAIF